MSPGRRLAVASVLGLFAAIATVLTTPPASAHGFTSTVYVDATTNGDGQLRTVLRLEYDLFVVSTADYEDDDPLFQAGIAAFDAGDSVSQAAALNDHADTTIAYVSERFTVASGGQPCTPTQVGEYTMSEVEGAPYAVLTLDWNCPRPGDGYEMGSRLFPDAEGYVTGTTTIVSYELDGRSGSAALTAERPSFSTAQPLGERFWEFFSLGAGHLLFGFDHILFLLALIVGSRSLTEIVLAASTFTVAHSVTFILAALGLVGVPASVVEPVIALSISVVAGWHLWRIWRRGRYASAVEGSRGGLLRLDRAGWIRLAVVFSFGLVHGLGFAGALGIDEAFSWTLLWSLLVFNLGIEVVELGFIVVLSPGLAVLRRRSPAISLRVTGAVAAGVAVMGLIWFVPGVSGG